MLLVNFFFFQFKAVKSKVMLRENRGMGANSRKLVSDAKEHAKEQLKNKYCLLHFQEDNSCGVVASLSSSICLKLLERLHVKVSVLIFQNCSSMIVFALI